MCLVENWEIIAENLSKVRMELGLRLSRGSRWANDLDCARTHRDGKRHIVRADEKLTAFLELESAMQLVAY